MMKMKSITLISLGIIVIVMLIFGQVGAQVVADSFDPNDEPAETLQVPFITSTPLSALRGTASWIDGLPSYSYVNDCITGYVEYGVGTYVGYFQDAANGQPPINSVYYLHVIAYGMGYPCGNMYTYVSFSLPPNTTLAMDSTHKLFCYGGEIGSMTSFTPCPQTLPAGYYAGTYAILSNDTSIARTWPTPAGWAWEFQIPVRTSTTLSGNNFQAAFHIIDGYGSPWLYPTVPIYVWPASTPKPGAFNKSAPVNGAKNQPRNLTLSWGTSANAASYEYCLDKTAGTTCTDSWKSTGTNKSVALSGLTSGVYYWQVNAKNASGSTQANAGTWWSFKVPPKPGAFGKTTPLNNALSRPITLTLYWGASSNAAKYEYCIKKLMTATCTWISTGLTRHAHISGLLKNTKYFWQVRAKNANGTTLANGGVWWNFTTLK